MRKEVAKAGKDQIQFTQGLKSMNKGGVSMKLKRITVVLIVGLLTISFAVAEAQAQKAGKEEFSILMFSSFVAKNDEVLKEIAKEFAAKRGAKVEVDVVAIREMYPKLTAEAESKAGHDIVGLENLQVSVYQESLLPINDVINKIQKKYGDFAAVTKEGCYRKGEWKALPWFIVPFNATYRMDYFAQVGEKPPESWDDLMRAGQKLKGIGHPIGFALGSCGDANNSLCQVLWAFGAKTATPEGVVAINSKETREAIAFVKELYQKAMSPDVLGWADNSANNKFMLSGTGSWTFNPISVWVTAKRDLPEIAKQLNHHGALSGKRGKFGAGDFYSLGIWKFSPNKKIANDFLAYLYEKEVMNRYLASGDGFNLPTHPQFFDHPVFQEPKLAGIKGYTKYLHLTGWPAPPDARAQEVYQRWVIPNLFMKIVSGSASVDKAINEAEKELVEVGYRAAK
jgi:multiple sugar transport system substrate-binding protein